jgi:hypothetical protein
MGERKDLKGNRREEGGHRKIISVYKETNRKLMP